MTTRIFGLTLVAVIALAFPASPALASPSGDCVTARVDAPFRLPDGQLYPAGVVTVCDVRTFSPVRELHKILVDGSSIGLFLSRKRSAEVRSLALPEVVFERDGEGNLTLIGYSVRSAGRNIAYRLKSREDILQVSAPRRSGGAPSAPVAAVLATAGTR